MPPSSQCCHCGFYRKSRAAARPHIEADCWWIKLTTVRNHMVCPRLDWMSSTQMRAKSPKLSLPDTKSMGLISGQAPSHTILQYSPPILDPTKTGMAELPAKTVLQEPSDSRLVNLQWYLKSSKLQPGTPCPRVAAHHPPRGLSIYHRVLLCLHKYIPRLIILAFGDLRSRFLDRGSARRRLWRLFRFLYFRARR